MNLTYGVITVVGVLVAISLALIIADPDEAPESRAMVIPENKIAPIEEDLNQISVNPSLLPSITNVGDALILEVEFRDDDGNIVDHVNYDIFASQDSNSILSDPASHRHPGKYPVHESNTLTDSLIDIQVVVQGLGHGDAIFGPKGVETAFTITPVVSAQTATSTEIKTADDSGAPGSCDVDCYTPSTATVDVGGVVTMINSDASGMMHTFTSGTGLGDELSGVTFDSEYLTADMSYTWTPEVTGEVPYYCQLHPWMIGTITVQEDSHAAEEAAEAAQALADAEAADVVLTVGISYSEVMGGTQVELDFSELHVNYDMTATQNGEVVFEETGLHSMENIATHQIDAVGSDDNPINVKVESLGIGAPGNSDNWTGPVGQVTTAQVVPEFGTIAMMVLAVAIISIVAVTAKSRVVPRF